MVFARIKNYLLLPSELTEFESRYLGRMNRVADVFFLLHIPFLSLLAFFNSTSAGLAVVLSSITAAGPLAARHLCTNPRSVSIVHGITSMFMGALLVHFGQGPVQIEMHFYFFVLLALLAVFANPMVIVAAAITVAAHHAVLWFALPSSVFNYAAPIWVVGVHALFVVLESVAACFIARSFFDNVIGLERKVAERTSELEGRNEAMRRILNTIEEGMFTVDPTGRVGTELSRSAELLLGPLPESRLLVDWLGGNDQSAADWLLIGLDEVYAGIMPLEITLDQLPKRCAAGARTLSIEYSPLFEHEELKALTVVVRDITAEVTRERLEAENREMLAIIDKLSTDRTGFIEFFEEADGLVEGLKSEHRKDWNVVKRRLHTLKGNCAIFGLDRVATICHHLETVIAEEGELPADAQWTQLFGAWAIVRGNLRRLLAENESGIELSIDQYQTLLMGILNGESKQSLVPMLASWQLEPTERRLSRLAEQAKRLAIRLGKGTIEVETRDNNLRIDSEHWAKFWSTLVHVIRNAIDHGLETEEDRSATGKTPAGKLILSTELVDSRFIVSISDDGRGLNWNKLRELASAQGLPAETETHLINALFQDGLSTAEAVTDVSGRGVGLSAVKSACDEMLGCVHVESTPGQGCEFRFVFDSRCMAPKLFDLLAEYGLDRSTITEPAKLN